MKPNKKLRPRVLKDLAEHFSHEFDARLPLHVMPNGDIVYKDYIVRKLDNGNWGLFDKVYKELKDQFFLKTCALMAAKAYNHIHIEKYVEIKRLDNRYWASYSDQEIFKRNIKTAKEYERYLILLTRLEDAEEKVKYYKDEISRMFKWSFV